MPNITVNAIDYNYNEDRRPGRGNRYLDIGINGEAYGHNGRPNFLLQYIDPAGFAHNIHDLPAYNNNANIPPFYAEAATEAANWQQPLGFNIWPVAGAARNYNSVVLNARIRLTRQ